MGEFMSYVLLGISLSAPIGPINAAQLERGMKFGFLSAWMVGMGAMLADFLYLILIYLGLIQFVQMQEVRIGLWIAGSFVLLYLGVDSLFQVGRLQMASTRATKESVLRSGLSGFSMALSNPLNILFWFGIYGSVLAETTLEKGDFVTFWNSLGIFAGILIWDLVMATLASLFQKFANRRVLQITSVTASLMLLGFAGYFAYQAHHALFG